MEPQSEIETLRHEINRLDDEIILAISKRTEISRTIGRIRQESGGGKIDPARERIIYDKYASIGEEGRALADLLLQLGRGKIN